MSTTHFPHFSTLEQLRKHCIDSPLLDLAELICVGLKASGLYTDTVTSPPDPLYSTTEHILYSIGVREVEILLYIEDLIPAAYFNLWAATVMQLCQPYIAALHRDQVRRPSNKDGIRTNYVYAMSRLLYKERLAAIIWVLRDKIFIQA